MDSQGSIEKIDWTKEMQNGHEDGKKTLSKSESNFSEDLGEKVDPTQITILPPKKIESIPKSNGLRDSKEKIFTQALKRDSPSPSPSPSSSLSPPSSSTSSPIISRRKEEVKVSVSIEKKMARTNSIEKISQTKESKSITESVTPPPTKVQIESKIEEPIQQKKRVVDTGSVKLWDEGIGDERSRGRRSPTLRDAPEGDQKVSEVLQVLTTAVEPNASWGEDTKFRSEQKKIDKEIQQSQAESMNAKKRRGANEWDDVLDQGRSKKIKIHTPVDNNPENRFQKFTDYQTKEERDDSHYKPKNDKFHSRKQAHNWTPRKNSDNSHHQSPFAHQRDQFKAKRFNNKRFRS